MIKKGTLKYKWMMITTLIMFSTIILFCLVIIFFLKDTLRDGEIDEAEHSSSEIVNLVESRSMNNITTLDLTAMLENFEKAIIYDRNGKQLMQSSTENMINFKPDIDFVDPETIQISKHNGIPYLIITEPIHSERFEGYSVLIHSLKDITMSFVLYIL